MAQGQLFISYGICPYRPHPSHVLLTDLSSLNTVLIATELQSFSVLKAKLFGLLRSPTAPLCQSVVLTYCHLQFAVSHL